MELLLPRILRHAAEQPEHVALYAKSRSVTYGEMVQNVRHLARAMTELGVARGEDVAIALGDIPEFVFAHLAAMHIGAVTIPLHADLPAQEVGTRLNRLRPRMLIADGALLRTLDAQESPAFEGMVRIAAGGEVRNSESTLEKLLSAVDAPESSPIEVDDSDVAIVVHTAGTSGSPRAVEHTHGSLAWQSAQIAKALRVRPTDRIAGSHRFPSICGLTLQLHLPLACGASACLSDEPTHASNLAAEISNNAISVYFGSPAVYKRTATEAGEDTVNAPHLRYLICSNGRLSREDRNRVAKRFGRSVMEGYSTTESCGLVSLCLFPDETNSNCVGEPFGDVEVAILDDQGRRVGAGQAGRIALRGANVMHGYRGETEGVETVLRDGWLLTDDIGLIDYQYRITVHGHRLETFSKGGFPVYAAEVETALRRHPAIREAAVVGISDPVYGDELKACLVCTDGMSLSGAEVLEFLKSELPNYKCPRIIRFFKELPHTPGGKINRGLLRDDRS